MYCEIRMFFLELLFFHFHLNCDFFCKKNLKLLETGNLEKENIRRKSSNKKTFSSF